MRILRIEPNHTANVPFGQKPIDRRLVGRVAAQQPVWPEPDQITGLRDRHLGGQIIWPKTRFAISRGHYHWQHECCFYAVKKGSTGKRRRMPPPKKML